MTTVVIAKAFDTIYAAYDSMKNIDTVMVGYIPNKVIRAGYGYMAGAGCSAVNNHLKLMVSQNKNSFVNKTWEDTTVEQLTQDIHNEMKMYFEEFEQELSAIIQRGSDPSYDYGFVLLCMDINKSIRISANTAEDIANNQFNILVEDITNLKNNIKMAGSGIQYAYEYIKEFKRQWELSYTPELVESIVWQAVKHASSKDRETGFKIFVSKLTEYKLHEEMDYVIASARVKHNGPETGLYGYSNPEQAQALIELWIASMSHNNKIAAKYKEALVEM